MKNKKINEIELRRKIWSRLWNGENIQTILKSLTLNECQYFHHHLEIEVNNRGRRYQIYIPYNQYKISPGYYEITSDFKHKKTLVKILRKFKKNSSAIQFIADMME